MPPVLKTKLYPEKSEVSSLPLSINEDTLQVPEVTIWELVGVVLSPEVQETKVAARIRAPGRNIFFIA
jgi:hypothetical protein